MKTKTIISFLSLCALLAFTGCEKNVSDELLPGANLSIRLYVDGPVMTRTTGSSTVADESTESAITSLDICLISTTDLASSSKVNIINNPKYLAWKKGSTDNVYEVNAVVDKDLTGTFLLYVIANRPSWMTNDKIDTYGELCGSFSGTAANMAACWADNSFLMINKQDDNTTTSDQAGVSVTMAPAATDEKVTASVTIERLATKILVKKNPNMLVAPLLTTVLCSDKNNPGVAPDTKGAIAVMDLKEYALFNCVNSFNLIQRWKAGTTSGKLLESPSSATTYNISTGYYYNDPDPDATNPLVFKDMGTVFYCMENNSPYYAELVSPAGDASEGTKMKGRVTGLVFKAQAGFIRDYNGLAEILEELGIDPNTIPWTTKAGSGIEYSTLYEYKGDYYGDVGCLLRNNTEQLTGLTATSAVAEFRGKGVKVYEDGYMYYNYWIEDPNYNNNGKKYLSVMRNTFYDINITAINSMGDEFPCGGAGYDATAPISIDVPKLKIQMDIPNWEEKTGNYTIGE